jgi:hypothetical protein
MSANIGRVFPKGTFTLHDTEDAIAIPLAYDTTVPFKRDFARWKRHDSDMFTAGWYNMITTQRVVSSIAQS